MLYRDFLCETLAYHWNTPNIEMNSLAEVVLRNHNTATSENSDSPKSFAHLHLYFPSNFSVIKIFNHRLSLRLFDTIARFSSLSFLSILSQMYLSHLGLASTESSASQVSRTSSPLFLLRWSGTIFGFPEGESENKHEQTHVKIIDSEHFNLI